MAWKQNGRARAWTKRINYVDGKPPRVLVVDDNQNAAEALVTYLEFEGIEPRPAFGGAEAIALARSWLPDVIVMDISMPCCNGIEASRTLRDDATTRGIAIIAFTALDEEEVRRHLADHEFDGYCQKGQPPTTLLALIWSFLLRGE
jgi:two-component system, OmpR family, response regulator